MRFQSTHSLRSATSDCGSYRVFCEVSIHALLAECDSPVSVAPPDTGVSIHALLAECDMNPYHEFAWNSVSIHALLAECDPNPQGRGQHPTGFNPRTPCGVRLNRFFCPAHRVNVSIHALLAECDMSSRCTTWGITCFNPRTPCGVRPKSSRAGATSHGFQSTHSLRSATSYQLIRNGGGNVSIHALLAECDMTWKGNRLYAKSFNPRTPCGVRLCDCFGKQDKRQFQSTHSLRSATCHGGVVYPSHRGFNPRTPCGVRLVKNSFFSCNL